MVRKDEDSSDIPEAGDNNDRERKMSSVAEESDTPESPVIKPYALRRSSENQPRQEENEIKDEQDEKEHQEEEHDEEDHDQEEHEDDEHDEEDEEEGSSESDGSSSGTNYSADYVARRRSTRQRDSNQSWIFSTCSETYSQTARRHQSHHEDDHNYETEDSPFRRSTRLRKRSDNPLASTSRNLAQENGNGIEEPRNRNNIPRKQITSSHTEQNNDTREVISGDMYSRLKTRRSARVNYSENQTVSRRNNQDQGGRIKEEPISKRLRERKTKSDANSQLPYPALGAEYMTQRYHRNRRRRQRRRRSSGSNSSSSSDSDDQSFHVRRGGKGADKAEKAGSKRGASHMQPTEVDPSTTFASVGGLDHVITKLREVVMMPLMYKEFYVTRGLNPPKGILFHGPPGTGKTMLARALANECSNLGGAKVSFFLRKGADLMNKWVGESEKQIRMLFEQAASMQPSIIFFDEIDGLAPARSGKTDQVYNSVISTFLAEIDGLKNRGDVIVIGATNRVDALDSALRRPGRFDFEIGFLLPSQDSRKDILRTYLSKWKEGISEDLLEFLAAKTVGFSGADLQLLCAEASLCALKRRYPQIYTSVNKFLLDYDSIKVERLDWIKAMTKVNASCSRALNSVTAAGNPLPPALFPLLNSEVDLIYTRITELFPFLEHPELLQEPAPKRFLIFSVADDSGLSDYILPAVLHRLEAVPIFKFQSETITPHDAASEIAAITQVFGEAARANKTSIVLIPLINILFRNMTAQGRNLLCQKISSASMSSVFVLATSENNGNKEDNEDDICDTITTLFAGRSHEITEAENEDRLIYLLNILNERALMVRKIMTKEHVELEALPLAPPPSPRKPSGEELERTQKKDNRMLRNLRKFLREVTAKLARNKKFEDFVRPVDPEEVPDYNEIVEHPMCLEVMMFKIDQGEYLCAADFLKDIYLIRDNATAYNPAKDYRGITHRSHQLVDEAHMIIDDEMDSDFEVACLGIATRKRQHMDAAAMNTAESQSSRNTTEVPQVNGTPTGITQVGTKRKLSTCNSKPPKQRKLSTDSQTSNNSSAPTPDQCNGFGEVNGDSTTGEELIEEIGEEQFKLLPCAEIELQTKLLETLATAASSSLNGVGISDMLDIRYQLIQCIRRNFLIEDKSGLVSLIETVISNFLSRIDKKKVSQFQANLAELHYSKIKRKLSATRIQSPTVKNIPE